MPIVLDADLLARAGFSHLTPEQADASLREIYEVLEFRLGRALAVKMSNAQISRFERYMDAHDDQGAVAWLESNFEDYQTIVRDELDYILDRLQRAREIHTSSSLDRSND